MPGGSLCRVETEFLPPGRAIAVKRAQSRNGIQIPASYALWTKLLDPGGDLSDIMNYVELLEIEAQVILVTHDHFDHCGGAARLAEITRARIKGARQGL